MSSPRSPLKIVPDHEPAGAPLTSWYTQGVTDGFGDRLLMFDNAATGPVELLRVRSDFATAPGFESALRARLDQLSSFTHPGFAKARVVNHLDNGGGLTVASTYVTGTRLSELFVATRPTPGMHPASVRDAFGELVASIAELHRQGRGVAHGALGAERVLLTFDRQLVVTDYVFGEALRQLNLTQEQLWTEFGLVSDAVDGATQLDQRADLAQLGLLMMSLVLGRRVSLGEYPNKIPALLRDFSTASDRRAPDVTAPLRSWLEQALDTSGFRSAEEAERALVIRPRRPHSINLQAALPSRVLGSPRVASTEAGGPPRSTPPAAAAVSSPTTVAQEPVTPSVPQVATPPPAAARPTPVVVQSPVVATPSLVDAPVQVAAAPAPIMSSEPDAVPPASVPPSALEIVAPLADAPSALVLAQAPPAATPAPAARFASPVVAPQPVAVAPPETAAPAPVESPATLFVTTPPAITPPVDSESTAAVTFEPVEQTVPPVAVPAPPVEPHPTVASSPRFAAEPPADVVFLAPLDLPPSRFLKLQPTLPAEPREPFVRLHTPAEPPSVLPPPVAPAPRPDAPMVRPEPFSWIADAQPMDPVDAVVASAPRSTPLLRWVTAALGILVITQGVIIVRLLSRQSQPAAATEQVLGTNGVRASDDNPSSVTPPLATAPDAKNGLAQDLSRVPASRNDAASPHTPDPTSATDSTAGTRRAEALGRTGGIKIVSTIPLQVMLGDKLIGSSQSGPVFTTPGTHDLDFVNDSVGFRVRQRVLVTVDKVVSLRINPPNGSVNVTATPWAQVWIDGRPAGNTPVDASVSLGEHEIVFRNPQLGVSRQKVVVQVGSPARVSASFTP